MLELKDLTVSYDICILDHVNYIFPDTGLVGIKGPSGWKVYTSILFMWITAI